jgi:Protein of unknown function (DUF1257)
VSHFVRIQTLIREKEMLTRSLRELHHQYQEGENLVVRGFAGNRETAEVVVNTGSDYDIGFQRKEEVYEVVADWWGVESRTQILRQNFLRQLNQEYARNVVLDQAPKEYLLVEEDRVLDSGEREIILVEDTRL